MTYEEAIRYWSDRINYEIRSATPGDLKLERMRSLLKWLGNPQDRYRIIHVAGTKGKGSTAHFLESILRHAGYRVGLFTSPHLQQVEERIQVQREPITAAELCEGIAEIAQVAPMLSTPLTFFEIGTALGFLHFARRRVDFAVVEVGLGGRFDSTNVCQPFVTVITSIGMDHCAQLGSTLASIAFQKAGIIKRRIPVVSGVADLEARQVIQQVAEQNQAPLVEMQDTVTLLPKPKDGSTTDTLAQHFDIITPRTAVSLAGFTPLGEHQQRNAALAVLAVDQLKAAGIPLHATAIKQGLERVDLRARIEVVQHSPTIILDTAHNVPSMDCLVQTLAEHFKPAQKRALVAISSDKEYPQILRRLAQYFDELYLTRFSNPRFVPPEKLAEIVQQESQGTKVPRVSTHPNALAAWEYARSRLTPEDLLCITGSVFLAGELSDAVREYAAQNQGMNVQ